MAEGGNNDSRGLGTAGPHEEALERAVMRQEAAVSDMWPPVGWHPPQSSFLGPPDVRFCCGPSQLGGF